MWRVLQPGRSRTNVVSAGFTGSNAAQMNHTRKRQYQRSNEFEESSHGG